MRIPQHRLMFCFSYSYTIEVEIFHFFFSFVDNSYVAVADVDSHVYVFCQPGSFGGELRNRKSGKVTTTIARQIVISLKNHDQVMGFHAAPNCLFILTQKDLFVYTLHIS